MGRGGRRQQLTEFARAGFQDLARARQHVETLTLQLQLPSEDALLNALQGAADPDLALRTVMKLSEADQTVLGSLNAEGWIALCRLTGASEAFGEFFVRHPALIDAVLLPPSDALPTASTVKHELISAVTRLAGEPAWNALRMKYRELLARIMLYDLSAAVSYSGALNAVEEVTFALSRLADAALEAALAAARRMVAEHLAERVGSTIVDAQQRVDAVRLAVIAMGKSGASELNVVSDVDIMFVYEGDESLATAIARETMRAIQDHALEPALWQVDTNLRPEGRHGALVRTLPGMLSYYERWAKTWEFQALLKARPCAGDLALGEQFVAATRPLVWASSSREDFVGSVRRMRERVSEHVLQSEADRHLKLGSGGLRDVEFSVQLLQLVHGPQDESLRQPGTIPALQALVHGGYVARSDGERLSENYRILRVLEHRLQLRQLRRTELMPESDEERRVLARASGLAPTANELSKVWEQARREVRELHLKIFYAPLLSAVAALPETGFVLGSDKAEKRLGSIGFGDPAGAIRHLSALTRGASRSTKILRHLLPVLLQWFGEGTDPDFGVLAFRRITEANRDASWYLRLLRDGTLAAQRLAHVLTNSRFAADLLESHPEAVAWLENDELLALPAPGTILTEMTSIALRQPSVAAVAARVRRVHRREVLRLAMGRVCGVLSDGDVAFGLDAAHTALLEALLGVIVETAGEAAEAPEISLIGMGRFGGRELGFASDIDLLAVARENDPIAARCVAELRELVSDPRFPVDLDFDLRPEGKNGPIVRSLASYATYYERWSLTWEAQALLRARHVAGSRSLSDDFFAVVDPVRYPGDFSDAELREVRAMKARIEAERLPNGADPAMHVKLGPGGLSDVEWLAQLLQLRWAHAHSGLRTVSTLGALREAAALRLFVGETPTENERHYTVLRDAWVFGSSVRSALKLWNGRSSDVLPLDWRELAGIAGVLGLPRDQTSRIVEEWRGLSRRARRIFEEDFFGLPDDLPFIG